MGGELTMRKRAMGLDLTIRKRAICLEFTMRKSDGVRVHHNKERWGECSP